jgi:hypothetical protein
MSARITSSTGHHLIAALPYIIRILGVIGTIAMLLVGGGMFVHNIEWVHQLFHSLPSIAAELLTGIIVGTLSVFVMQFLHSKRHYRYNPKIMRTKLKRRCTKTCNHLLKKNSPPPPQWGGRLAPTL